MEWKEITELAREINLGQLIAIGIMLGFFCTNLSKRIDGLEKRMTELEIDMIEVKTILRIKECYRIQDERKLPKAE